MSTRSRRVAVSCLLAAAAVALAYAAVILWVTWSGPPFELPDFDGTSSAPTSAHDGPIRLPIALSALAGAATVWAVIASRRSAKS